VVFLSAKNIEKMLERVLKKITPSEEEKKKELALVKRLIKRIKAIKGKHLQAMLCGSLSRDTHLRGERDFDIFVLFDENLPRDRFESEGIRIGKEVFKGYEHWLEYSEHPYVKGIIEGYEIEIVPCYRVKKACLLKSSVDRSPFHARFLKRHLKEEQKKEVRLLKAFMKGVQCYGADIASEGFPGYLAELLILKYGTFLECIKNASQWKPGTKIALKDSHLKKCKVENTLVFPDPTDPKRNVASALSLEQFSRFVAACRAFLKKPSEDFFFGKKVRAMPKERIKKELQKRNIIAIEFPVKEHVPRDIIFGQLKRFKGFLTSELQKHDFKVFDVRFEEYGKNIYCFVELEERILSEFVKLYGPPVFDEKNCEAFLAKHRKALSGPRIENERLVIVERRKHRDAKEVLKALVSFLSMRGKEPLKSMLKKARVLEEAQLLRRCKQAEFARIFTEFLKDRERFL
jgi:tRNA nucleotidyltransferase (CCA-adding enzyme)